MSAETAALQYSSYNDIDIIRGVLNINKPLAAPLGNTVVANTKLFATDMKNVVPAFPAGTATMSTDDIHGYGQHIVIDEPSHPQNLKTSKPQKDKKDEKTTPDNEDKKPSESDTFMEVLTHDYIGTFYFASITVIGLYVLFRMVKK